MQKCWVNRSNAQNHPTYIYLPFREVLQLPLPEFRKTCAQSENPFNQRRDLQRTVQVVGDVSLAVAAALGSPKEGVAAIRAVVALALGTRPFRASGLIAKLGDLFPPAFYGPVHDPPASCEREVFNVPAWPFSALVAGVKAPAPHAVAYGAGPAKGVKLAGRVRLHTAKAPGFLRLGSVKVSHHLPEFFVSVPASDVNAAGPAVQPARGHELPVRKFLFGPALHFMLLRILFLAQCAHNILFNSATHPNVKIHI